MAKKRSNTTTTEKTETQQATEETQKTEEQSQTEETKTADETQPVTEETQIEGGETQQATTDDTQKEEGGGAAQGDDGSGETSQETGGSNPDETQTPPSDDDTTPSDDAGDEEAEAPKSYSNVLMTEAPEGMGGIGYKLGGYIDEMQPNRAQDEASLQKNQLKLRGVINNVLDLADDQFGAGLKFLVGAVREHRKTVFSETMVFRGFDRLRVGRGERQKLETLISLLLATADVKNPKDVSKSVDMKVVYRFVTDNNQQQKLQSYYGA